MYDPEVGRWHSLDPLAEKYYSYSPYVFTSNNPIVRVDLDGRSDDWYYSSLNGKYLGQDEDKFSAQMRLIDDKIYKQSLVAMDRTNTLKKYSKIISIDEAQIQINMQSIADKSRASGLEHSVIIVLDRENASVSARSGPIGTNDQVNINYYEAPATGASFHDRPGGPIIIGQAHGHPASSDPNKVTSKTMSSQDVNVAIKLQIPIYGIDAMGGRQGKPANIHRANPDGTIDNKIGTTQNFQIGQNAMRLWGISNKPLY